MQTVPCPSCSRPNGDHRPTCLYCGGVMPNPVPRTGRSLPDNLDQLVGEALRRGSVAGIREALTKAVAPAELAPVPAPPSAPAPHPGAMPPRAAAAPRAPRNLSQALADLAAAAEAARTATDPKAALDRVEVLLAAARKAEPASAHPPPPAVALPSQQHAAFLVVRAADPDALVAALGIDRVTAQVLSRRGGLQVALRAPRTEDLRSQLVAATRAGLSVAVHTRDSLHATPPARCLLSLAGTDGAAATAEALWLIPTDPARRPTGDAVSLRDLRLVVPGEITVRRQRAPRASARGERARMSTAGAVAEERLLVVDLHTADHILRAVPAHIDLRGTEWEEAGSVERSFRAWLDALAGLWPTARVEPRRACGVGPMVADAEGALTGSGWAAWEEHTRICRLHPKAPST